MKVAETGSFTKAAHLLFMSPAATTRAVAWLEELIGTRLFVRTTRAVRVTDPGRTYLLDCRRILADLEDVEAAAGGAFAAPSGTLTVTAPGLFGLTHVLPILIEYLKQYPLVTGRSVFVNRVANLVDEEIDVAIRIGPLPDSGYRAIQVGSVRSVVCGAPSYFATHGTPVEPADLLNHTIIAATELWTPQEWKFGDGPGSAVTVQPRLFCNTDETAIAAAIEGWGLTRLLAYKVGPAVLAGKLQCILSEFEEPPTPIHVIHAEARHVPARVRAFVDLAVKRLRENEFIN